jgi:hypothetical protein
VPRRDLYRRKALECLRVLERLRDSAERAELLSIATHGADPKRWAALNHAMRLATSIPSRLSSFLG